MSFNWHQMSGIGSILNHSIGITCLELDWCHHSIGIASLELIERNTIYEYDTIQLVSNARNLFKLRIFRLPGKKGTSNDTKSLFFLLGLKCTSRTGFESESFFVKFLSLAEQSGTQFFSLWKTDYSTHYVDWDFNSKNTSHFQFLQKPFIHDVYKPLKRNWKFSTWDLGDICIYPFWNRMGRPG